MHSSRFQIATLVYGRNKLNVNHSFQYVLGADISYVTLLINLIDSLDLFLDNSDALEHFLG